MHHFVLAKSGIFLTSVVWTYNTFDNNFVINYKLENHLKETCLSVSNQYLSFEYYLNTDSAIEISQ